MVKASTEKSSSLKPRKGKASDKDDPPITTMSFRDKYNFLKENITVEPMLACYIIPSVLASLATQNLNLEKACRVNLGYSTEVCDALRDRRTENFTFQEKEVQQLVASMGVWKTILQSALPAFLIMFVGSWSDRWGKRKPCMLLPIVGELLTALGLLICTYFFDELPMEVAGFVEGLFPAMTGGWFTMFMGVFSYIADVTTVDTRTLRIGIVNLFCSLGIPIGLALSGVLYKKIGFYGVFSISSCMYVMAIYYGYKKIEEPKKIDIPVLKDVPCAFLRDFFDVKHLVNTFKVAFKSGPNNRKMKVMLLMLVVMVVIGPMHGEMNVAYLFTRYRFNWDEVDFSIFSTYSMITNLIGTAVSVGVFSHLMKIDDGIIGIYSSMSKILSSFVYGFAMTSLVFYLGAIVEILNGTSFIAMRSIASKLVPSDELGKLNSLFGACEALMPLLYGPMYSATYAATINTMPGAFFILGGILTIPAVIIFGWFYLEHKKDAKSASNEADKEIGPVEEPPIPEAAVFAIAPKQVQMGTPVLSSFRKNIENGGGIINKAFINDIKESEKRY
ncbi:proton-coupled folate transporter-like isoform X2 [Anthonomus grandis grandis]|nr:proton-coupled folate transporter-like isoform X2 [Anthonomus grandis grandis]